MRDCDVMIIGGGPAGASTALSLRRHALSVMLVDKGVFPRDKTCGDALSVDVINQLNALSPTLLQKFETLTEKVAAHGVRVIAPNGNHVDIPFKPGKNGYSGYVCRRNDFDNLLFDEVRAGNHVTAVERCEVKDIVRSAEHLTVSTSNGIVRTKIVVGADGAHSVVKRKLTSSRIDPALHSAGLRRYYQHVTGFNEGNFIELYFLPGILPGYLWVFPLPGQRANVGIGMLSAAVSAGRVNLAETLEHALTSHPLLKGRFRNAVALERPHGHGLPLGNFNRPISGERFILTGDAASLIDPFSGEGIGNAIRSGRFAAQQVAECFRCNDFSALQMSRYDSEMKRMLKNEFRVSHTMLRLCKHQWLFNAIVNKAARNPHLHQTLVEALAYPEKKKWLTSPSFYLNLFFRS